MKLWPPLNHAIPDENISDQQKSKKTKPDGSLAMASELMKPPNKKLHGDIPPKQAMVLETADRLWPNRKLPLTIKERNHLIVKNWNHRESLSDKTIQRAFANRTRKDNSGQ
jgi:hypothetical protein